MKTLFIFLILISICEGGCADNPSIVRVKDSKSYFDDAVYQGVTNILAEDSTGSEQYRAYQQAATGSISELMVREEVEEQADRYCENMGKKLKILQERRSVPPHILGNFPKAELVFVCSPKTDTPNYVHQTYLKFNVSAADWKEINYNSYFDVSQIEKTKNGCLQVWIKLIMDQEQVKAFAQLEKFDYTRYSHSIAQYAFNCKDKQLAQISGYLYDKYDNILSSYQSNTLIYATVIPESHGETWINKVCNYAKQ